MARETLDEALELLRPLNGHEVRVVVTLDHVPIANFAGELFRSIDAGEIHAASKDSGRIVTFNVGDEANFSVAEDSLRHVQALPGSVRLHYTDPAVDAHAQALIVTVHQLPATPAA